MAIMGMNIQLLTPVSDDLRQELTISFSQLGVMMGIISLPGIFLSLPAGRIADKTGRKKLLILGLFLLIPGSLCFCIFKNYMWSVIGRILAGIGCSLISSLTPGLIPEAIPKKYIPAAMGIFNTAIPIGSILTLTFYHKIAETLGVFESFYISAVIATAIAISSVFIPETRTSSDNKDNDQNFSDKKLMTPISLIVLAANFASMGYVTVAPAYYQHIGIPWTLRGTMLSAILWGSIAFAPAAGWFISKFGHIKFIIALGLAMQGAGLAAIPIKSTPLTLDLIIMAIGAGIIMTPIYILIPKIIDRKNINLAFGIMISAMMIGCLAGPYIAGVLIDAVGYEYSFAALGLFSAIGLLPTIAINEKSKNA